MRRRLLAFVLAGVATAVTAMAPAPPASWIGAWASAQQVPEPQNALDPTELDDATLRQIVHLSIGGPRIRVRLSNAFGAQPLRFTSVHVALARAPGSAATTTGSDRTATFGGEPDVVVPAGADYWSDPVDLQVEGGADLSVSFHFGKAPDRQTSHPGARSTAFLAHGDQTAAPDLPEARKVEHWFELSGVDVQAAGGAILTFGDSITDGHGSTLDGDDRWPDDLARRLRAAGRSVGVLNVGIGGNRLLLDGLGPNALARFDRDVLAQHGVRAVVLLEGVNDLGTFDREKPASAAAHRAHVLEILTAYAEFVAKTRAAGLKAIGATVTPFVGSDYYHPAPADEADRQVINAWIRRPGHFDAVIDFDKALRDPVHPDRLAPSFDSGDHLHPSPSGYRAMAEAVPLDLFP